VPTRIGHSEAVYNIFAYLEKHVEANMAFDDKMPQIDELAFHRSDWSESIYGEVEEEIPPNAPKPLGSPVMMTCFVDANHAGDKITRRSQTGFIIYLNNAPIDWFSKKQNTCESSTFGSGGATHRAAQKKKGKVKEAVVVADNCQSASACLDLLLVMHT
jgi:hypothetical protein